MKLFKKIIVLFLYVLILSSCSKDIKKETIIKEKSLDLQVLEAYKEGIESLESGDVFFATKKFNEAEILYHNCWAKII